jgi:hypothetical protein
MATDSKPFLDMSLDEIIKASQKQSKAKVLTFCGSCYPVPLYISSLRRRYSTGVEKYIKILLILLKLEACRFFLKVTLLSG